MKSEPKLTAKALAEKAAIELDAAKAKAELLGRKSAEASAKFQAQAEGRRQTFMKKWLAEEFVQAPEADIALCASKAALEAAVEEATQADPVLRAWLAYARASMRISTDGQTAQNFALKLGESAPVYYSTGGQSNLFETMHRVMEHLASKLEGERTADIYDALEDAAANGEGEGDA